jgi:drug/metabolite transporter, DME family
VKEAFALLTRPESRSPRLSERGLGLVAVGAAAALWAGGAAVARTLFDRGVEPVELVEARAVVAALGLSLLPAAWRRSEVRRPGGWNVVVLGVALALVNLAYYLAIDRLAVAVAIVLQYSAPALVVVWASLRTRRLPGSDVTLALCGAVVGVVLVSGLVGGRIGSLDAFGIAMGLASAVLFATYTLVSEPAERVYGPVQTIHRAFGVAAVIWIVAQIPRGWPSDLFEARNVPLVLLVGIAGTLLPFLLYVWGVGRVRSERASIAATLEPVLAALFAWAWLDQRLTTVQLAGGVLVVGAVLALQLKREARPHPEL